MSHCRGGSAIRDGKSHDSKETHLRCVGGEPHGELLHFRDEDFVVKVDNVAAGLLPVDGVPSAHDFRLGRAAACARLRAGLIGAGVVGVLDEDAAVDVTVGLRLVAVELHDVGERVVVLVGL